MRAAAARIDAVLRRRGTTPADVLLAVALTVLVLGELHVDDSRQSPAVVAATAAGLVCLCWRRRAPVAVAAAVLAASTVLAVTAEGEFRPQLPFLADLLVVYTVAAHVAGRRAVAAGAAALALLWTAHVLTVEGDSGDFLPLLVWGAPWAAGRLVRRRTLEAAASASRAALLVQRRDEQLREAAARERDRIARELHDVVAHGVSLMVVQAGAERLRLASAGGADPTTLEVLEAVEAAGRDALGELRTMLSVLRSPEPGAVAGPGRAPVPTLDDLPSLLERVRAAGLPVRVHGACPPALPSTVSVSAYRVVQEALTNVLKHAPGARTDVELAGEGDRLLVAVRSALPPVPSQPSSEPGRGLVGMAERAALLGGEVEAGPCDGRWVVELRVPLGDSAVAP